MKLTKSEGPFWCTGKIFKSVSQEGSHFEIWKRKRLFGLFEQPVVYAVGYDLWYLTHGYYKILKMYSITNYLSPNIIAMVT